MAELVQHWPTSCTDKAPSAWPRASQGHLAPVGAVLVERKPQQLCVSGQFDWFNGWLQRKSEGNPGFDPQPWYKSVFPAGFRLNQWEIMINASILTSMPCSAELPLKKAPREFSDAASAADETSSRLSQTWLQQTAAV
jgi:hypothetical protein